ncbi:MAG: HAMP domain-containing sensor histidine kinase [Bacteroidota bacterium]
MTKSPHKYSLAKKSLSFFILAIIFILTALIYERSFYRKSSPENITHEFQETFISAEKLLASYIDSLNKPAYLNDDHATHTFIKNEVDHSFAFHFFKYLNDSLVYWSGHSAPAPEFFNIDFANGKLITLANGKYFYRDTMVNNTRIAGMFLVKSNYPYQNIYLENRFQKAFDIPSETMIGFNAGVNNIYAEDGSFICSLQTKSADGIGQLPSIVLLILYALAFLALSTSIFHLYQKLTSLLKSKLALILAFSIDILIIRVLMFIFKFPEALYNSPLFSPASFAASDYIPSLGDFFFNALALFVISYVLYITFKNTDLKKKKSKARRYFLIFSLFLHIFIFYRLFLEASRSLIMDASYSINLNQIFFLTYDSFLAIIIFTLLLFSFFLVSYRILGLSLHYAGKSAFIYFGLFLISSILYAITCYLLHDCIYWLFIPLIIYIIVFYFLSSSTEAASNISFSSSVIYLFLFAILSTSILSQFNYYKETEQRRLLSIDLASGEDPLSEYILLTIGEEMQADSLLHSLLSEVPSHNENIRLAEEYIEDNYLSGRMSKYEWMVTICTPQDTLDIQPEGYIINCYDYFTDIIETNSQPGIGYQLYSYDNEAGMCNYISRQDYFFNETYDTISVFIELFSFFIPEEGLGYPELLIDEKIKTFAGLENYSYARYKQGKLVFKYGNYPYRTHIEAYLQDTSDVFFQHNNNDHYISKIDTNEHIIISKSALGFLQIVAPFSYLLIFFTLFLLLFLLGVNIPFGRTHIDLNFRNRLQAYIISLIIISFIIIGAISVSYVINLNTTKNKEILQEKAHSVLIELEHKLAHEQQLTADMEDYLTNYLIKFSKVFFSDINLYDLNGKLLASSRPQIFQKQLISKRMNVDAYRSLTVDQKLLFLHTETIGDQDYFSAYVPFRNRNNKVIAYLNLPYFAKQTELQNEISAFLNAFLNVYVLMTAVAIFIALLISRFTTRPLQLIRDKMGSLSLGGTNEKINWSRKDEIGTLITEYNRMIDELSRSAELLAKSERESAWREMAKQVAHEIKNPLTPMKLSVQHLQKAWDEKSPGWEDRLSRFTQTIIEHIDTLSDIASEFSDFAKMPQKKESKIDLSASIHKSIDLFSDTENIQLSLVEKCPAPHYVFADKNQLIRVFNNLIKNSVQAIGKSENGLIEISIDLDKENYVIRVSDNGPGISPDMMDKIFSPSFTTKTSGMGLGLALVRSIIQEAGGIISFESSPASGTVFIIFLPVYS